MKRKPASLLWLVVLFIGPFPTPAVVRAQQGGFGETFDDPRLPGWENQGASVLGGALRVEPGGFAYRPGQWDGFSLTIMAYYGGTGEARLDYCSSPGGTYTLHLRAGTIWLSRLDQELGRATHEVPPGEWARLSISVSGGAHRIVLNNRQVISLAEPDPLPPGGIRLSASGAAAGFDDLALEEAGAPRAAEATQAAGEYTILTDIAYAQIEGESLLLDVYRPATPGPHPAVIQMHGGAFVGGHKDGATAFGRMLAGWGYTMFAINYRLAPAHRFPAGVADVQCAVRWVREHASDYSVDPDRIALMGDSAGGNLAALAGLSASGSTPAPAWQPSCGSAATGVGVQAIVSLWGPTDFSYFPSEQAGVIETYIGTPPGPWDAQTICDGMLEKCKAASPITYVSATAPPTLLIHGTADSVVSVEHSRRMDRALRAAGADATLVEVEGAEHGFAIEAERHASAGEALREFLDAKLAGAGVLPVDARPTVPPQPGAAIPAYQAESWVRLGGPPGGIGYDIRMRPDDPDMMFVTDGSAGVFRSIDGGRTWVAVNAGMEPSPGAGVPAFCATIDPRNPDVVWVGTQLTGHLYRSVDGGQTWEQRDQGITNTTEDVRSLRGITIDPNDGNTMYLGLEVTLTKTSAERQAGWIGTTAGEVYKSTDGGESWKRIWHGPSLARYVWVDPRNSKRLYVSTGIFDRDAANRDVEKQVVGGVGILRSDDGGETWTVLNEKNGLGGVFVPSLFMHPVNPDILLAAVTLSGVPGEVTSTWNIPPEAPGVYVTYNGGDSWQSLLRHSEPSMDAVEISTADPNVWYAATENVIYSSDDAGQSWQRFDMVLDERKAGMPIDLQADPRDSQRIFVNNYGGGNMVSSDGGRTWSDASQGYTAAHVGALVVHPAHSRSVLVGVNTGTYYSRDGGLHWSSSLPFRFESFAFLPQQAGAGEPIVVGGDNTGRFYRSDDGGATWNEPMPFLGHRDFMSLRALAIAPSDTQTMYAGFTFAQCIRGDWRTCTTPGGGLFVSRDGGGTWQHLPEAPFADLSILAIALDPQDPLRAIAATATGLYATQDGGEAWQELRSLQDAALQHPPDDLELYPESFLVFDVAFDPFTPQTLYAATARAAVLRSDDGGITWWQAGAGMDPNEPVYDLVPDPNRQGVLYASSWFAGVFVTTDGAQSWRRLSEGLPSLPMRNLALSPDGSVLYAGTLSAGIFRLGTPPSAVEPSPAVTAAPTEAAAPSPTQPAPPSPPAASPTPEKAGGLRVCGASLALPLVLVGAARFWRRR